MEHEDKTQNFLHENLSEFSLQQQNRQNLFESLQNASGFGAEEVGDGIGDDVGVNIGGKFEEEEHDEEWKIINEVQQSEKQTMKKVGGDLVGVDGTVVSAEELIEIVGVNVGEALERVQPLLLEIEKMEEAHNSPTSIEESSLATNSNSNNSSSENCEENLLPQREHETTAAAPQLGFGDFLVSSSNYDDHDDEYKHEKEEAIEEDKENADPDGNDPFGVVATAGGAHMDQRPSDLDFSDMHSNLNPEAKEFVPICSNPTTPTTPTLPNKHAGIYINYAGEGEQPHEQQDTTHIDAEEIHAVTDSVDVGEPVHVDDPTAPHPIAVPRHLLSNAETVDDFVAESPRKGRGADMDAISLPAENEFDDGADKRPHELEEEKEILENEENIADALAPTSEDKTDFKQITSPVSLIDHGPETSVDLDLDVDMDSQDIMRKSIYIENEIETDQPIEDLLNTVQPIPTDADSINNSFAEDFQQQQEHLPMNGEFLSKELLNVEEKEVISHSPSTEELQMQFQTNDFSSSSKDIPAIPVDLENAQDMEESIYLEHTSNENAYVEAPRLGEVPMPTTAELEILSPSPLPQHEQQLPLVDSLLLDTSSPLVDESNFIGHVTTFTTEAAAGVPAAAEETLLFTDFIPEKVVAELVTPSPHLTEEKHLLEETKENRNTNDLSEIEEEMSELLHQNDGKPPKQVEVEQTSTPIDKEAPHQSATFTIESGFSVVPSEPMTDVFGSQLQPQEQLSPILAHQIEEMTEKIDIHKNFENYQIPTEIAETNFAGATIPETEQPIPEPEISFTETTVIIPVHDVPIVEPAVPIPEHEAPIVEPEIPIVEPEIPIAEPEVPIAKPASQSVAEIATVAAVATTAAVAVAAAAAATAGPKKPEPIRRPTAGKVASAAPKSKVGITDAKKATTTESKKPTTVSATKSGTVSTAARPRTAPVKTATEKKTAIATSTAKPTATSSTTTNTVRKHVTATSSSATKPAASGAKTTATSTAARTTTVSGATGGATRNGVSLTAKTTASRPATATAATARKLASTTTTKARPASAVASAPSAASPPTKPSTLGINAATNKPLRGALSPRTTLNSQLRKTTGGATSSVSNTNAAAAAKSPMKLTTNGIAGKVTATATATTSTTSAGNRKTTTTTTTTKTFTARPVPKTTTTTTTTTARRSLAGTSAAVGNSLQAPSPLVRKSMSPSKRSTTSSPASGKLSPTKAAATTTANAKNKTKDSNKATKIITATKTTTKTTTIVGASGDLTAEMLKEKQQQINANIMGMMPPHQANGGSGGAGDQIVVEHIGNGENGTHHHDHEANGHPIEQAEIALM